MSQEMPTVSKDRADFTANEEDIKNLKAANEGLKDKAFDEAKTENTERDIEQARQEAEAKKAIEEAARVEQATQDAVKQEADATRAAELAKQIKGEHVSSEGVSETQNYETPDEIYGMNLEELGTLIKSRGYTEVLDPKDPAFQKKYQEFTSYMKSFEQARVKLFDRVLSGKATEGEVKIATDHATEIGKTFDLRGFHSAAPKAWYSDDRIAEAISATNPENRKWVESVRKDYSNERLRKQIVKIEDDGNVVTYEPKEGI